MLSVIVPTVGRETVVYATVASLLPQLGPDEELIVVDQNQPPLNWPPALADDTRLVLLPRRRAGLTRARNAGLRAARHAFAVFLDDDILPDADLLARFRAAAARHPQAVWTGRITQADRPASNVAGETAGVGAVDLDSGYIVTDYTNTPQGEVPFFAGGLCLLPLAVTGRRPLFAPAFRGASQGEEIDLALRLKRRGVPVLGDPSIHMVHLKAPTGGCRSEAFLRRFAADEVFNRAYFWGRHGRPGGAAAFFKRMRGFIEFHGRREPSRGPGRHDSLRILRLMGHLLEGLLRGWASRPFMR